jgi:hypothetical protein
MADGALACGTFSSLETALNTELQEFQFGRWLRLLTTQEYEFKATAWRVAYRENNRY